MAVGVFSGRHAGGCRRAFLVVGGFDQRPGYPTKWLIKFADELPLAVNVFVLWLVAVTWSMQDATP
jgi:hypothetical protein